MPPIPPIVLPLLDGLRKSLGAISQVIKDQTLKTLESFKDGVKSLGSVAKALLAPLAGLGEVLKKVGGAVSFGLAEVVGRVTEFGIKVAGAATLPLAAAWEKVNALTGGRLGRVADAVGGYMGKVGEAVGGSLGALGGAALRFAGVAGVAAGAAIGLGKAMEGMVGKANPAAVLLFNYALEDLMAVVGQALTPVFVLVTQVVRMFADTLATFMLPLGQAVATILQPLVGVLGVVFEQFGRMGQMLASLVEAIAPGLNAMGQAVVAVLKAIQPLVDLLVNVVGGALAAVFGALGKVIEAVVPYITAFVQVLGKMVETVVGWVRQFLSFLGIDVPDAPGTKPGSSVGAAVRSASIGSVESYQAQAITKAFSLGSGAATPESKTASAVEQMNAKIDHIYNAIAAMPEWIWAKIVALPEMIGKALAELWAGVTGAAGDLVESAGEVVSQGTDWVDKQWSKPGVFGYTSINPFS